MKKFILDLELKDRIVLNSNYVLLKLRSHSPIPNMLPGQFAELKVDNNPNVFLRRPISINFVDNNLNEIWFLVQIVGEGTKSLCSVDVGQTINTILPLGNTFTIPENKDEKLLLVGGGVGTAPMLYLGYYLKDKGYSPSFLLGARSKNDLLQLEEFSKYGNVYTTTEDGSYGEKGYVTNHSILETENFDRIYTCGPKPMMVAISKYANQKDIFCEVSLENTMACGIGACLCCVENTEKGNTCVCTEGPIFNIKSLLW